MIKLFLVFLLTIFIHADIGTYLFTKNTRCVFDLIPNPQDTGFCYRYFTTPNRSRCTASAKITQFIKGYDFNNTTGTCELEHDLQITGLDKDTHTNIMLYTALAFSLAFFSILFMLVL